MWTSQDGAFDDAVKGVDAIEHTASPADFKAQDPQGELEVSLIIFVRLMGSIYLSTLDLIRPAVQGTVNILRSALDYGFVTVILTPCKC